MSISVVSSEDSFQSGADSKISRLLRDYYVLTEQQQVTFQQGLLNKPKVRGIPSQPSSYLLTWADMDKILKPITWAWDGWLANGFLTILASESGMGKSGLLLRICGSFLCGDDWPDGQQFEHEIGGVLWCEAEAAQALNLERAKAWGLPVNQIYCPLGDTLEDINLDNRDRK